MFGFLCFVVVSCLCLVSLFACSHISAYEGTKKNAHLQIFPKKNSNFLRFFSGSTFVYPHHERSAATFIMVFTWFLAGFKLVLPLSQKTLQIYVKHFTFSKFFRNFFSFFSSSYYADCQSAPQKLQSYTSV